MLIIAISVTQISKIDFVCTHEIASVINFVCVSFGLKNALCNKKKENMTKKYQDRKIKAISQKKVTHSHNNHCEYSCITEEEDNKELSIEKNSAAGQEYFLDRSLIDDGTGMAMCIRHPCGHFDVVRSILK